MVGVTFYRIEIIVVAGIFDFLLHISLSPSAFVTFPEIWWWWKYPCRSSRMEYSTVQRFQLGLGDVTHISVMETRSVYGTKDINHKWLDWNQESRIWLLRFLGVMKKIHPGEMKVCKNGIFLIEVCNIVTHVCGMNLGRIRELLRRGRQFICGKSDNAIKIG